MHMRTAGTEVKGDRQRAVTTCEPTTMPYTDHHAMPSSLPATVRSAPPSTESPVRWTERIRKPANVPFTAADRQCKVSEVCC